MKLWTRWLVCLGVLVTGLAHAAPGDILFSDDFNRSNVATGTGLGSTATNGVGNSWTVSTLGGSCNSGVVGNTGCAGIDADVPPWNSAVTPLAVRAHGTGSRSLFLRWDNVAVDHTVNLASKPGANMSFWVRRGWDCISEAPGGGNSDPGCSVSATITVGGSGSTSVSGIKVNGVQIMSAASTASATTGTVATNIDTRISLAGFSASTSGNVITITGPGVLNGALLAGFSPVVTVGSGTMTFTTTTFANVQHAAFTPVYGEEFLVQYLNSASAWVTVMQVPNDGTAGEEILGSVDLPSDALWSGFKIRFYQPSGSGYSGSGGAANVKGYDYWHVDDVKVTELAATSFTGAFCDTFEGDLSRWTVAGVGDASIGPTYYQNGTHSLTLRWGAVSATSKPTDMTGVTGPITYWVKRGVGTSVIRQSPNLTGSDLPDSGEDLVVEYLKTNGTWGALVAATSYQGGGTSGQVYTASVAIPADANLTAFQMRFRLLTGTGFDMDYWHVDDLCVGSSIQSTDLSIAVTPANTNMAPGATTTLTATVTNLGPSTAAGPITVTDTLPNGLVFVSASAGWTCISTTTVVTCNRIGSLAVNASTSLVLTVQADPVSAGTFTNTLTVGSQSSNDPVLGNNTATNTYTFKTTIFEAYETTTTPTSAVSGNIFTKLAGVAFNLKVVAVDTGVINTAYNKTATVDLIDANAACASATTALSGVTVSPANHLYVAGDAGVTTYTFTSTNAYANVQVRIKDNAGSVDCSSDQFAIRPQSLTVSSSDATADATGLSTTAAPRIKAGTAFALTADTSTVGYNGTPTLDTSKVVAHTGAVQVGALAGTFGAATAATGNGATGASFTYGEVGYFRLNAGGVVDSTFTTVDSALGHCVVGSFSNTADASGKFGCNIGSAVSNYFGRFTPDHFDTTVVQGCAAGSFTYGGQAFAVTVTARNGSASSSGVAQNYSGSSWAKAVTLSNAGVTTNLTGNSEAASAFTSGVGSANVTYTFPSPTTAPVTLVIRAVETSADSISSAGFAEATVNVRSGRVRVLNAYGSELLDLPMSARAEYWVDATNGWQTNTADSCTTTTLTFTAVGTDITSNTCVWDTGSAPGNSGKACITSILVASRQFKEGGVAGFAGDFNLWLKAPGATHPGSIDVTAVVPAWLQFNWTGTVGNPKGRATFGVYKSPLIYRRENY